MAKIKIIPDVRTVTAGIKESDSYFLCPANTVMTGRYHYDDENGQTQYEYATLKAVDENGNIVSGTITVENVLWSPAIKESDSSYISANRVIVGRQHNGNENGDTKYATAIVKFNGVSTFVGDMKLFGPIKESSGIWFRTSSERVIVGRIHNGDENGDTYYYAGAISSEAEDIKEIKVNVYLHSEEEHFPMDPMQFIKESRFRKHNAGKDDDGYSKVIGDFVKGNDNKGVDKYPEYYDIPVEVINSFNTGSISSNMRPHDEHSIGHDEVFLQPDDHPIGNKTPTGNVPVFVYSSNVIINGQPHIRREYWLFYGYDKVNVFSHQGDWERVTLDIYNNQIVGAWLDQHGKSNHYDAGRLELSVSNGVQILNVYSAKGSHATYEKVGNFDKAGLSPDRTDRGRVWEITKNVMNLADQPWKMYAGAWGEVGMRSESTGPLGPWYKRMDISNS